MSPRLRLILIAIGIFAWSGVILSRLFTLQYERHEEFAARAEQQYESRITLDPKRGTIYDRDGRILAINIDVPSVYAVPNQIEDPEATAALLAPVLEKSQAKLLRLLDRRSSFIWLSRKIDPAKRRQIEALEIEGIEFVTESKRVYPSSNLAGHVLGFVGIDNQGLAGVEYSYEKYLRGNEGIMLGLRGAKRGYNFSAGKVIKPPTGGNDVHLTLDARIQHIVEVELSRQVEATASESGTVVVMNPHTGAILALANYPDYDPNHYGDADPFARKNRAVVDAYEPGSTFKIITAAAAFEAGIVSPDDLFDCQMGSIVIGRRTIRDHKEFGVMSFRDVMKFSSNVGAIKVGALVGEEPLWNMADRFGYGSGTGIDLPAENRGILRKVEDWSANSYGSISIGQEVSGPPVQIILNLAVVANGGYWVRPHIVERVVKDGENAVTQTTPDRRKIISDETIALLRDITRGVVFDGGGTEAALGGINAAGKTGTGEIAEGGRGYVHGAYLASFAGYFPYENPEVVVLCMLVKPQGEYYGGQVAAPLFAAIGERLATELEVDRQGQRWVGADFAAVDAILTRSVSTVEPPRARRIVPSIESALIMPDLRGMPLRDAVARLGRLGLVPTVHGSGVVQSQNPEPGEAVSGAPMLRCGGTGVAR